MDKKTWKYVISIIMVTISIAVTLVLGISNTYSIEVVGEQYGLKVQVSDVFEPTGNLNPGDTKVSTMTVSVIEVDEVGASSLPVWISWKITGRKPGKGGGDLDDKLEFSLYHDDGTLLYNGPFSGLKTPIALGNISRGDSKELTFKVHLPGESTGNEYMGASLSVKWTVMTQYQPPETTPSPTPTITPTSMPTSTPTPTPTPTSTSTPTPTPTPTSTPPSKPTPKPRTSPTPKSTPTPATTPTPTPTPTSTPGYGESPSPTPTATPTSGPHMTPTPTITPGTYIELDDELIPGSLPKTGELAPVLFYSLGALLIFAGVIIGKKKSSS